MVVELVLDCFGCFCMSGASDENNQQVSDWLCNFPFCRLHLSEVSSYFK